jgi:hypothetical protein
MEANISNYLFKLDTLNGIIEVFSGSEADKPCGFIRVKTDVSEKDFHVEISDWFLNNSGF